ncbi:MAPEG family protein [Aquicoccus sp. G2-2]|uniref:MAPEG family protein n=1 Tax=Aquicoccus sp. G2-2 TaxID=3092120 RepID=UPI002AE0A246|nr:MAPEG family protein [Aquicoccus sp. G2-2]MEA1112901.1 MAPEG family protein [Aquicoccus sp. G2-2]
MNKGGGMRKRSKIGIGMGLGMLWAVLVVGCPQSLTQPFVPINVALISAFVPGGLFLLVIIGRLAQRRFFEDAIIDGDPFRPGSPAEIDQRVLQNTVEQLVLAMALWPFVGLTLGALVVIWMGVGFAIARIIFWLGYHLSPPLRAFGFAASFYPTVLGALWAIVVWAK